MAEFVGRMSLPTSCDTTEGCHNAAMASRNRKKHSEEIAPTNRLWHGRGNQGHEVPIRIALVVYPNFEPLDLTGPFSVFAGADDWLRNQGRETPAYTVEVMGAEIGPLRAEGGLGVIVE